MHHARRIRQRRWDQISFLDDAGATTVDPAPHELEDALGLADHAADPESGRAALDRLYSHLAQQAIRRGRTPIPKRSDAEKTS
jgi:hypothetical protein